MKKFGCWASIEYKRKYKVNKEVFEPLGPHLCLRPNMIKGMGFRPIIIKGDGFGLIRPMMSLIAQNKLLRECGSNYKDV